MIVLRTWWRITWRNYTNRAFLRTSQKSTVCIETCCTGCEAILSSIWKEFDKAHVSHTATTESDDVVKLFKKDSSYYWQIERGVPIRAKTELYKESEEHFMWQRGETSEQHLSYRTTVKLLSKGSQRMSRDVEWPVKEKENRRQY